MWADLAGGTLSVGDLDTLGTQVAALLAATVTNPSGNSFELGSANFGAGQFLDANAVGGLLTTAVLNGINDALNSALRDLVGATGTADLNSATVAWLSSMNVHDAAGVNGFTSLNALLTHDPASAQGTALAVDIEAAQRAILDAVANVDLSNYLEPTAASGLFGFTGDDITHVTIDGTPTAINTLPAAEQTHWNTVLQGALFDWAMAEGLTAGGAITNAQIWTEIGALNASGAGDILWDSGVSPASFEDFLALSDGDLTADGIALRDSLVAALNDAVGAAGGDAGGGVPGAGAGLWFQVGANATQGIVVDMPNIVEAVANDLRATFGSPAFGQVTNDSSVGTVANGNGQSISDLLVGVDRVLTAATAARGALGAIQNRLEFTIQNLDVSSENLSAANSRIRDADMAMEMMRLTQANVLQQAATAMLAQGNQAPQSILQLLG
jgi:flagellin